MKYFLVTIAVCAFLNLTAQNNQKLFSVTELQADYDTLHSWIRSVHPKLYANADSSTTEIRWQQSRLQINKPMTRWEFHKAVAPLVHQYNDGHTFVEVDFNDPLFQQFAKQEGLLFPMPVKLIGDSIVVMADSAIAIPPGSIITSINGRSAKKVLADIGVLLSGDSKENLNANITRLFSYLHWLAYQSGGPYKIGYRTPDKRNKLIVLKGMPVDNYLKRIFPSPLWTMQLHPESSLAVIECSNYSGSVDRIRQKLDSFFTIIRNKGIRHVALDLRRNGGGNSYIGNIFLSYVTTKPFRAVQSKSYRNSWVIQNFPETDFRKKDIDVFKQEAREENGFLTAVYNSSDATTVEKRELLFTGEFYLLTSHRTYSSAHMTALQVKCSGLGTIIGQPTGEMVDLTGEIKDFELPNTKLPVWIPLAMYKAACPMPTKVGVQPDYHVQPTVADVIHQRDAEVEFLKTLIRQRQ